MNLKPVLHRVFVKPDLIEDADDVIKRAKAIGLQIEFDKREQKAVTTGIVTAVGSTSYVGFQTTAEEQGVVVGSRVLYVKYAGSEIPNSDMVVLNDEDILCVIGE